MKEIVKELLGWLMRHLGFAYLIRRICARTRVTILVYHDPTPEDFRTHMEYLSARYTFITLDVLADVLETGDWASIPPYALVVTIDDGHKGNYALLDVLKVFGVRPTMYLCSQIVDTSRHFWWKEDRAPLNQQYAMPHAQFLKTACAKSGFEPRKEYSIRQSLNREELMEMAPYVQFGSHTRFHPVLPQCGPELAQAEIQDSKSDLERLLEKPVEHFCYPYGSLTAREETWVKEAGYRSARSLRVGWNAPGTDPYALRVTGVQDNASINVLCGQVSGLFGWIKQIMGHPPKWRA